MEILATLVHASLAMRFTKVKRQKYRKNKSSVLYLTHQYKYLLALKCLFILAAPIFILTYKQAKRNHYK